MFSKPVKGITMLVLALLLLATSVVQPASATSPEELSFTVKHGYVVPTDSTAIGSWKSEGILENEFHGEIYESYFWAGWDNEDWWFVKTIHTTITLKDANGTITIKAQSQEVDFEPFGLLKLSGNWVIVDGSGDYAGLHGQGSFTFDGMFYWDCSDENDFGITGPCIVSEEKYTDGQGHFDP